MDPVGQIAKIAFEVLPVRFHRHPVYLGPACRSSRRYALSGAAKSTWCSSAVNRICRDGLAASFAPIY
jgi:hypothetical protein